MAQPWQDEDEFWGWSEIDKVAYELTPAWLTTDLLGGRECNHGGTRDEPDAPAWLPAEE